MDERWGKRRCPCMESAAVISLRAMKMAAGGPEAIREAQLMVSEKLVVGAHVQAALLTGAFSTDPARVAIEILSHL